MHGNVAEEIGKVKSEEIGKEEIEPMEITLKATCGKIYLSNEITKHLETQSRYFSNTPQILVSLIICKKELTS